MPKLLKNLLWWDYCWESTFESFLWLQMRILQSHWVDYALASNWKRFWSQQRQNLIKFWPHLDKTSKNNWQTFVKLSQNFIKIWEMLSIKFWRNFIKFYVLELFIKLRETRRIHFHHSWYLETLRVPSYVHFWQKVNEY